MSKCKIIITKLLLLPEFAYKKVYLKRFFHLAKLLPYIFFLKVCFYGIHLVKHLLCNERSSLISSLLWTIFMALYIVRTRAAVRVG